MTGDAPALVEVALPVPLFQTFTYEARGGKRDSGIIRR